LLLTSKRTDPAQYESVSSKQTACVSEQHQYNNHNRLKETLTVDRLPERLGANDDLALLGIFSERREQTLLKLEVFDKITEEH
jgi:hypothetical protein